MQTAYVQFSCFFWCPCCEERVWESFACPTCGYKLDQSQQILSMEKWNSVHQPCWKFDCSRCGHKNFLDKVIYEYHPTTGACTQRPPRLWWCSRCNLRQNLAIPPDGPDYDY